MTLLNVLFTIVLAAALVWLILKITALQAYRNPIIGIATFFVIVVLLQGFGVNTAPIPHLRLW